MARSGRKTLAETKAECLMLGFNECMRILEREWRSRIRVTSDGVKGGEDLWRILEKMQAHSGLLEDDYKELSIPRLYGRDFERLRVRVELLKPHPHAGRKGFILNSEAFMKDGMHRVYFLDESTHRADNAFARPEHIRRL